MKITYRLPTKEPYSYIEIEDEATLGNVMEKIRNYEDYQRALKEEDPSGSGIPDKDFNLFLDTYLKSGTGSSDVYAQMNAEQQKTIQCIKRSLKRIKSNPEEEIN